MEATIVKEVVRQLLLGDPAFRAELVSQLVSDGLVFPAQGTVKFYVEKGGFPPQKKRPLDAGYDLSVTNIRAFAAIDPRAWPVNLPPLWDFEGSPHWSIDQYCELSNPSGPTFWMPARQYVLFGTGLRIALKPYQVALVAHRTSKSIAGLVVATVGALIDPGYTGEIMLPLIYDPSKAVVGYPARDTLPVRYGDRVVQILILHRAIIEWTHAGSAEELRREYPGDDDLRGERGLGSTGTEPLVRGG